MSEPKLPKRLILPDNLISVADLSRTVRELSALDESLHQTTIRASGQPTSLVRTSRLLEDLATANNASLLDIAQRTMLLESLKVYADQPVRIHMSFAAEPSLRFCSRIIVWLRHNIDPMMVLEIGLQPSLTIGCIVRTENKVFDMSLQQRFVKSRHLITQKILGQPEVAVAADKAGVI